MAIPVLWRLFSIKLKKYFVYNDFTTHAMCLPLSDQEFISSLNNQPGEPEEDDNSEEENAPDKDLSIGTVFNAVKMLWNYMVPE